MKSTLSIKQICKSFKSRQVVKAVDIEIAQHEIVGLLGPNGAGKTTTFYMIVGLIRPDSGQIYLNNEDITSLAMHTRAHKGIGYLPQERSIFRKMTTADNIAAILQLRKDLTKIERKQLLDQLLDDFNIDYIRNTAAISLSGGESRRVEIARALAMNPKFMLLDEPFAGIDPISITEIKRIITKLSQRGIGVLITDHNVRDTLQLCHRAYVVNNGSVIAQGNATTILSNKTVKEVYLGDEFTID